MASKLIDILRWKTHSNLGHPQIGVFGWLTKQLLLTRNNHLELNAVKISKIQPDHDVLEVGFGPGLGLQEAYDIVRKGNGTIYGIDTSTYMLDLARKRLKRGIADKKVVLFHGNAANIPLKTDSIDRVYHCNCYYFWPSIGTIVRELYRVMKPGARMVTTMNFVSHRIALSSGVFTWGELDPAKYMTYLEKCGFEGIRIDSMKCESSGLLFQAIVAEIGDKPAHREDNFKGNEEDADDDSINPKFEDMVNEVVSKCGDPGLRELLAGKYRCNRDCDKGKKMK